MEHIYIHIYENLYICENLMHDIGDSSILCEKDQILNKMWKHKSAGYLF